MVIGCGKCKQRPECKTVCYYVEQELIKLTTKQREKPIQIDDRHRSRNSFPETVGTTEIIFQLFFFDHKTSREIAEILYVSKRYVNKVLHKQKQILKENLSKGKQKSSR